MYNASHETRLPECQSRVDEEKGGLVIKHYDQTNVRMNALEMRTLAHGDREGVFAVTKGKSLLMFCRPRIYCTIAATMNTVSWSSERAERHRLTFEADNESKEDATENGHSEHLTVKNAVSSEHNTLTPLRRTKCRA